jgi:hypothetical protein
VEAVTFGYKLSRTTTDDERTASVEIVSKPGTRNVRDIYIAVEETLGSGKRLRTYFDVWSNTQVTYLPKAFFDAEQRCLDRIAKSLDYVENHFSESVSPVPAPGPPPNVPRTRESVMTELATLRVNAPELLERAVRALDSEIPAAHRNKVALPHGDDGC